MTTRRTLTALLLAAALAAPGAVAAPTRPTPQLHDPAGDWALEGQDIVSGRFSSVLVKGIPHLRGELTLAGPPAGVQTYYALTFVHGCHEFHFAAFVGSDVTTTAPGVRLDKWAYCFAQGYHKPEATYPATLTVRGSTVTWLARYAGGVRRGSTLSRFTASAFTTTDRAVVGDVVVEGGDYAKGGKTVYVVGSDLPRR